jgi:hypothetical protein
MATIEVDFDVFKALTALRDTEETTYNDVVRKLLCLEPSKKSAKPRPLNAVFGGVSFPEGTLFLAHHRGMDYTAHILGGQWINEDGSISTSPSDAAVRITHKSANGWRFWKAKRPGDDDWRLLDELRPINSSKI